MNKQELIEKLKTIDGGYGSRYYIAMGDVFELVEQLDEPQKVVIPQFVADAIESARELSLELEDAFNYVWSTDERDFNEWYRKLDNRDIFARAWLDGYEVEKEKRYMIKLKRVPDGAKFLKYTKVTREWYFGMRRHYNDIEVSHTRKELEEAGFGWVFDCEGIEVEEVTE
uniref:Phage protein n=2 Tax=unclassified Caudoviricetes TaxID=2788787 RepID=A0A8S5N9D9_9CAUD|nr:MAG TPA: Protein of unknown function (DUF1642) [Siphoviridae sp. ctkTE1]DAE10417.1 MAG TPA: Protein of unknown function (DUF1642) [Siphoviridae sp. ct2A828]